MHRSDFLVVLFENYVLWLLTELILKNPTMEKSQPKIPLDHILGTLK